MPPLDSTAFLLSVFQSVPDVKAVLQMQEDAFYSPKKTFADSTIAYYYYWQPFFIVFLVIWMILTLNLVWIGNHKKNFGLMIAYTSLDLAALAMQNIALIAVFSTKNNYLKYELCYVYEAAFTFLPMCLHTIAQWLKVGQTLTVFIMLYTPLRFRIIVNTKACVLFILLSVFLGCSISTIFYLFTVKFEKATVLDKATNEVLEVCRTSFVFTNNNVFKTYRYAKFIITIINDVVQHMIPGMSMTILCVCIHRLLKQQIKTRKSLNIESTEREKSDIRLSKVTIFATIIYVIFVIPDISLTIMVYTDLPLTASIHIFLEILSIISRLFFGLSIPINFCLFSWLNGQFRSRVFKILKRLHICKSR